MLDLAVEADDESLLEDVQAELDSAEKALGDLEFRRSTRLGIDVIAHVFTLDRAPWF